MLGLFGAVAIIMRRVLGIGHGCGGDKAIGDWWYGMVWSTFNKMLAAKKRRRGSMTLVYVDLLDFRFMTQGIPRVVIRCQRIKWQVPQGRV